MRARGEELKSERPSLRGQPSSSTRPAPGPRSTPDEAKLVRPRRAFRRDGGDARSRRFGAGSVWWSRARRGSARRRAAVARRARVGEEPVLADGCFDALDGVEVATRETWSHGGQRVDGRPSVLKQPSCSRTTSSTKCASGSIPRSRVRAHGPTRARPSGCVSSSRRRTTPASRCCVTSRWRRCGSEDRSSRCRSGVRPEARASGERRQEGTASRRPRGSAPRTGAIRRPARP